jgi:hypothetical protein
MHRLHVVCLIACLGLGLTTSACGSGGGDRTAVTILDPQSQFSGTYCIVGFAGDAGLPDQARTTWGTVISDGSSMITGGMTFSNENGTVSGPNPVTPPPLDYNVDDDYQLAITFGGLPFLLGGLTSDGNVGCVCSIANEPGVFILGRKSGTYSNASLNGLYHLCAFFYDQAVMEDGTRWGTVTFDGAGGGSTNTAANDQGVISGPAAMALTYAVASNGSVTGMMLGRDVTGQILAGGELLTLAGDTVAGHPIMIVLIRATTGASDATLSGTYHGLRLEANNGAPPDTWTSSVTRFVFDGAGMFTIGAVTNNMDGMVTTSPVGGGAPYAVLGNGELSFAGGAVMGAVSGSGRFVMAAGGTGAGDDPEFYVMVR